MREIHLKLESKLNTMNRIPKRTKRRLLNKVFFQNKRIKMVKPSISNKILLTYFQAAKELKVNYQSAKSILFCYRKRRRQELRNKMKNCSKRAIAVTMQPNDNPDQIRLIKTQGRINIERLKQAKITSEGDILFDDVETQKQQFDFLRGTY